MKKKPKVKFKLILLTLIFSLLVSPFSALAAETSQPWMNKSLSAKERAHLLLEKMTLEEKVSFVTGNLNNFYGFYNEGLDRLGIPALTMADGPAGVRIANPDIQDKKSTALPAPIALAASWDEKAAQTYGELIGNEAYNTTHNVVLGPGLDIARFPWGERNFESLGEDQLLQSKLAVPYVNGIQSYPVMATAKHFLLNNQETERFTINSVASERAIQEVYARPFADVIQKADLSSVMCSFNKVNGTSACENGTLLTDILKDKIDFEGFVMSDYGANYTTAESANAGLDLETPGTPYGHWEEKLLASVKEGQVSEERIDDMVFRILTEMFSKGLFDQPVQNNLIPAEEHGEIAREIAEQSMVLMKNEKNALPLDKDALDSIAVIGPDADNASAAGGGSSLVIPTYTVSPLEGIKNYVGEDTKVTYAPGSDPISAGDILPGPSAVPSSLLSPGGNGKESGLKGEYWTNLHLEGEPYLTRTDNQVNFNLGFYNYDGLNAQSPKLPKTPGEFNREMSARWTGDIAAPATGEYVLSLSSLGTGKLYLDGKLLIDNESKKLVTDKKTVSLKKGEKHQVRIEYSTGEAGDAQDFGAMIRFGWEPPKDAVDTKIQEAVKVAKDSDVAVVVTHTYDSEGYVDNNSLDLPNNQAQLIEKVSEANPNTIVVQMSGRAVQMDWQDEVPAIVQAWFAGQEQGNAIANVLFGEANPSGKLPITFPVDEQSTPVSDEIQFPGVEGVSEYTEGVFTGYKGYEKEGIEPAFAFGHGLSYTTFDYKNVKAKAKKKGKNKDTEITVDLNVRNTGDVTGSEVVQVYAGKLPANIDTPAKQLAGFKKVELKPGKQQRVKITLDAKVFSYWDEKSDQWVMPSGKVPIYVGSSSEDIRLVGSVQIR
ncbi:beta-glucosidase H [Cytobacillus gottheilii]|uniref:Glycoside hydrolase family 3 C-terminal domain-containing protein n=1 Tax=Cytobacillus gottheilii TaxID=859144 RepID=A0ABX8FD34_9BACI|nr:glycoside hydrolase family 3 C-terminal domain-containing protein [Cytobacillus gottheilii]QVY61974.1 glycoside hydrolase family 3 C-terminal domain-containing protein [Cytobacillus gottheilii]